MPAPDLLDPILRLGRRLRSRLVGRPVGFVYSRAYQLDIPAVSHDPARGERVLSHLAARGILPVERVRRPRAASMRDLQRVHTDDYLEALREPEVFTRILGFRPEEKTLDRILDMQRAMVGGTLLATRRARDSGEIAFHLGGGLHHAFADRGERFCILNDVAVAIAAERARGFTGRVLVVDLDLHDSDGIRSLFADDPTVHTYSIHNQTDRLDGAVEATVLELGSGVEDRDYLATLEETLPELFERFAPELVYYLAGTDPAVDDLIGDWRISGDGLFRRDRRVVELTRSGMRPIPLVILLAGGYGRAAWRYTARCAGWLLSRRDPGLPPSTEESTLDRYRRLAALLDPRELTGEPDGTDWSLSPEDLYGALAGPPHRHRFLGYYSKHGIELALERGGVLERIRELGFPAPTLEFDLDNPGGETIRLFGDAKKTELLLELRARRDRSTLPGMELLRVEWLLLQNPRKRFPGRRPPLPGQRHPGLGMLKDATSFLVLACERLGLDGVFFVPSHYHLAAQSRKLLCFLDPEDAGRFRALRDVLGRLPLTEATRAVEEGRVRDAATGEPYRWEPAPMVLPVSDRLQERLLGEEYEDEAEAVCRRVAFELEPEEG